MQSVKAQMLALAIVEFILATAAVQFAALVRFVGDVPEELGGAGSWLRAAVFGLFVVVALTAMGLYQLRQRLTREGVAIRIVIGLAFAGVGLGFIYYIVPFLELWRGWMLLSFAFALVFLLGSRALFMRFVDQNLFRRRVLIYGAGKRAASLLQLRRRSDQRGFQIVAFVPVPNEPHVIQDERVDCSPGGIGELALKHDADEIVIAMDDRRRSFPIRELLDCKFRGVDVVDLITFLERETGKVKVDLLDPSWMIFSEGFTRRSSRMVLFRLFDLGVSILLFAISWPVMLVTAIAILLEDGSPVLYRQTRVGMLGKQFDLLKFRSMAKNAEAGTGARWAQRNDSRVTKVGAITRKLRIDELPQLFNVIRGDMRFIGPRPERPEFVEALSQKIPYYHERHCVKPGLTGWAQLCYPYGSTEADALQKLEFDLYYVKNQSLIFDLMILLQTVEVVLWRKGAR